MNEMTTVSFYRQYMLSDGTLLLSIRGMWTTDSSHFISLLTTAFKYVTTISFIERPSDAPLQLHAFVSNNHPVFRKCFVWISLDAILEVGSFWLP